MRSQGDDPQQVADEATVTLEYRSPQPPRQSWRTGPGLVIQGSASMVLGGFLLLLSFGSAIGALHDRKFWAAAGSLLLLLGARDLIVDGWRWFRRGENDPLGR